jgi:deazaflavin-dependent oxidoreductase (nitroreductase family)
MNTKKLTIPKNTYSWVQEHIRQYLEDGAKAHDWDASRLGIEGTLDTLLLVTLGRKSGNHIVIPLLYQPVGNQSYCIVASRGGTDIHPAWYLNLQAQPRAQIKVRDDVMDVFARTAMGEERDRLWRMMCDYYPAYVEYQNRTDRHIPVVVLEPVTPGDFRQA